MRKLTVSIAVCVCLLATAVWAGPSLYRIQANVKASLTFPDAGEVDSVEYVSGDSEIRPVALRHEDDRVSFDITPEMLSDGDTIVIFNRPRGRDLSDRTPPSFDVIRLDGNPVKERGHLTLPFVPGQIEVVLTDPSGISARGLDITVNGNPAARDNIQQQRRDLGRYWKLTYSPDPPEQVQGIIVTATDRSLLANTARFALSIERGLQVVEGDFSGKKAVELTEPSAFLARRVDLPAGEYELEVIGSGPSGGANSLWIELDGQQQSDPVHLPVEELATASRMVEIDPELLPRFTVPDDGEHALVLALREGPTPTVDRVRILHEGQQVAAFEAEEMLPTFPKP